MRRWRTHRHGGADFTLSGRERRRGIHKLPHGRSIFIDLIIIGTGALPSLERIVSLQRRTLAAACAIVRLLFHRALHLRPLGLACAANRVSAHR